MKRAGFVLAGGRSTRMGRDKALLPWRGKTLLEHIASEVRAAAGSVTVIGPPGRYRTLDLPVVPDCVEDGGPLGGVLTALTVTPAEWNLVLACDMPSVSAAFLESLLELAEHSGAGCLVPVSPSGQPEPLCAVYHRDSLPAVRKAVEDGRLMMATAVAGLRPRYHPVSESEWFRNVNAPEDWLMHRENPPGARVSTGRAHG